MKKKINQDIRLSFTINSPIHSRARSMRQEGLVPVVIRGVRRASLLLLLLVRVVPGLRPVVQVLLVGISRGAKSSWGCGSDYRILPVGASCRRSARPLLLLLAGRASALLLWRLVLGVV